MQDRSGAFNEVLKKKILFLVKNPFAHFSAVRLDNFNDLPAGVVYFECEVCRRLHASELAPALNAILAIGADHSVVAQLYLIIVARNCAT